jgi:pilus assembly protein CpaF
MLTNPLRPAGPPVNPWERFEAEPLTSREGSTTASSAAGTSEYDQVMDWLQEHHADLLADPQKAPRSTVTAAIHAAVMTRALRKGDADRLTEQVTDQLLGAGPLAPLFRDPAVTEILINGPQVYVERQGRLAPALALSSSDAAIQCAQLLCRHEGREYQSSRPLMNFMWSDPGRPGDGARINLVHHSKAPNGVAVSIRKRNAERLLDLPDLLHLGMLSAAGADLLVEALAGGLNVIFSGAPGTGKTALMRAIGARAIGSTERVITMEDVEELRLAVPHVVSLIGQTDRPTAEERVRGDVSQEDLFRNTLRMRYDRLWMGELRGPEAFDFLEAMMSSVGGMASSIHLRRPELLVSRLYQIACKYQLGMPRDLIASMVSETIDLIVQVDRDGTGHRHVTRIAEVTEAAGLQDVFRWNPETAQLEAVATLSADRTAWMRAHTRTVAKAVSHVAD